METLIIVLLGLVPLGLIIWFRWIAPARRNTNQPPTTPATPPAPAGGNTGAGQGDQQHNHPAPASAGGGNPPHQLDGHEGHRRNEMWLKVILWVVFGGGFIAVFCLVTRCTVENAHISGRKAIDESIERRTNPAHGTWTMTVHRPTKGDASIKGIRFTNASWSAEDISFEAQTGDGGKHLFLLPRGSAVGTWSDGTHSGGFKFDPNPQFADLQAIVTGHIWNGPDEKEESTSLFVLRRDQGIP